MWDYDPARVVAVVPRMAILAKKCEVVDVRGVERRWQYSQPFPNLELYIVSAVSTKVKNKTNKEKGRTDPSERNASADIVSHI